MNCGVLSGRTLHEGVATPRGDYPVQCPGAGRSRPCSALLTPLFPTAIVVPAGLSAPGSARVVNCSRRVSHIVWGSKKKKAEKRVRDGRRRLADVIQELQTSTSFDRDALQSRLQEVRRPFPASVLNANARTVFLLCSVTHPVLDVRGDTLWLQIDTVLCGECEDSTSSSSSSDEDCLGAEMGNAKSAERMQGEASNVVPMRGKLNADKGRFARPLDDHCVETAVMPQVSCAKYIWIAG